MYHIVVAGETLGTIAAKYLGSSSRWREIYNANPSIKDPNLIYVGQTLVIPEIYGPPVPPGFDPAPTTPAYPTVQAAQEAAASSGFDFSAMMRNPKTLMIAAGGALLLVFLMTKKPAQTN